MLKVYDCLATQHDPYLLASAAILCLLAAVTTLGLLGHTRRSGRGSVWLIVTAMVCGFGIWATHFTAMQAFQSGLPTGFAIGPTIGSLAVAMVITGAGFWVALSPESRLGPWLGGAIVGVGIVAMHYLGMAGFEIAGRIAWDETLVALSIGLGVFLAAAAVAAVLSERGWRIKALGVLLLTTAISAHHIGGMAAVTIVADPTIGLSEYATLTRWLVIATTAIGAGMLLLTCVALLVDKLDRQHAAIEGERMRGLANAAVEGLLVCRDTTIVTANTSFAALSGRPVESLDGTALGLLIPDEAIRATLLGTPGEAVETTLLHGDGSRVAVALVLRPIDFGGGVHNAIAVRDLRDRKKAEEDIQFLAHHDALTGLPNRAAFTRTLEAAIAKASLGERIAVLCLDLDRFKETNDLFGHAAGDALLRAVARCVGGVLGEGQTLARLGGDEFAIVTPGLAALAGATGLAERVLEALRGESAASQAGPLAASIGIALWPDHAADAASLLGHADTAMYGAKADGRGLFRVYDPAMGAEVRDRRMLEHDLRLALERGEFHLVYQPQTSIASGDVVGFEALLRWRHPLRGNVPPDHFIPIAEETGSISAIGEWVLRTACREAATWSQPLRIAINVSAVQIHSPDFSQLVHEVLIQTGLSPGRLEVEITETALIRDFDRGLASLRLLKALGVRIAMDDFGTGYSSLSNLRAFPFDKIKIDRSFIMSVDSNSQAAAIVRAVMGLGRGLALPVLAEGVETAGELAFLLSEGCQEAQGYLMGRPGLISEFAHVVDEDAGVPDVVVVAGRKSAA